MGIDLLERMPAVFAHRGGWGEATQNTLRNLEDAAKVGANLEYDVRQTLDGVLVVHHNARVNGHKLLEVEWGGTEIAKTNFADLPRLASGDSIPTVREVMEMAKREGRAQLVETKVAGDEGPLLLLARELGVGPDQLFLQSYKADSIRGAKALAPEYAAGVLGNTARFMGLNPGRSSINIAKATGADFVLPRVELATDEWVDAARSEGLGVVAWSRWKDADAGRAVQLLQDPRIDGLIVNEREAAVSAAHIWRGPTAV
jgi:glycerophosphoryl diester phosphodiesterase